MLAVVNKGMVSITASDNLSYYINRYTHHLKQTLLCYHCWYSTNFKNSFKGNPMTSLIGGFSKKRFSCHSWKPVPPATIEWPPSWEKNECHSRQKVSQKSPHCFWCPILWLLMVHVPGGLVVMFTEVRRCSDCVLVEDIVNEFPTNIQSVIS